MERSKASIEVGGFTPLTTIDYPDHLSAVVFCQGCPWRCRYCQNGHLLERKRTPKVAWNEILRFLERRRGLLDAVVFSGGEPTLQKNLVIAVRQVRELGYGVALHTAGSYPNRLATILPYLDWVGIDIKGPFENYERITGVSGSGNRARESLQALLASGIDYEVRTTVHPELLSAESLSRLIKLLKELGVRRHVLQECILAHCLDSRLIRSPDSAAISRQIIRDTRERIPELELSRELEFPHVD